MRNSRIYLLVLFLLVITGLSLFYDYPATLLKRPQSIHSWRQCDGASLALNYYQEGMHFFKPQTHGLYSDGFTNGYTAPSEIPILYYFVAILYSIFGYHEFIFRALNLFIFYLGLFYLFKLSGAILKNFFYAAAVVILLFSSPLIVYYANNFMPNTVALSFTIIGWYYFYQYYLNHKIRSFLISMVFFGLAGAMKITELTGPIIILTLLLTDRFKILHLKLGSEKHFFIKIGSVFFVFMIVAGWVAYAKWYNTMHGSFQFSTQTFPLWNLHAEDIDFILHKMNVIWLREYYRPVTLFCILFCAMFTILFYKRADRILGLASVFLFIGLIAYSVLWFEALGDHDYFYICFYILPVFIFINFFKVINSFKIHVIYTRLIQVIVLVFLIINFTYARHRHHGRYYSWMNDYQEMQDVYLINPYLKQRHITRQDTIVYFPSLNIRPLYLMNLKGWTLWDHNEITIDMMHEDSVRMVTYIKNGATYFVTNNLKSLAKRKSLLPYTQDLYGKFGNVHIFRIPALENDFVLTDSTDN